MTYVAILEIPVQCRASVSAMVVLPEPDTPHDQRARYLPAHRTKILRQRSLITSQMVSPVERARWPAVLAIQHARQDRALLRARDLEQHFAEE